MSARTAHALIDRVEAEDPRGDQLGTLFLKCDGIKHLVVASPGDIYVECPAANQDDKPAQDPANQTAIAEADAVNAAHKR